MAGQPWQETRDQPEQNKTNNADRRSWPALLPVLWLGGLAIAAFALWGFVELAEQVFQEATATLDQGILLWLRQHHQPWLTPVAIAVTGIGEPGVLLGICLLLSGYLLSQRRWSEAAWLALGASGAVGLNAWLKLVFSRSRPALWERVVSVDYYSFPSGHAMVSLVVYGLVAYWLVRRWPQYRWAFSLGYGLVVVAIGLSRLYLGVHWPTDVLAGYAAGLAWLMAVLIGFNGLAYWRGDRPGLTQPVPSEPTR